MMEKYFERPPEFKRLQERPQLHYQFQPSTPKGPDLKWRYMWRVGPRPFDTHFKELNSEPEGFTEWKDTIDSWGHKMISAIEAVAEMAVIGFGLSKDAFTFIMKQGVILAVRAEKALFLLDIIMTLTFLTIHGRNRFPGLNIWLRNGQKVEVKVPLGCLLIQTGKQRTIDAVKLASEQNRSPWRVSSTAGEFMQQELSAINLNGHKIEA
ncbi:hypothetical protein P3X46_013087 [Hevea brasiliensis]|uniref:Uncharacterized protein n=1 Tax=Hevea brasiliensis TaxID=3981 RepID=A0ABQ9M2L5_HEVBR|nr:hypothetical protein P3X46_013087 [Hevea brasiliensis]